MSKPVKIVVLSDTHTRKKTSELPPDVVNVLMTADVIVHLGDFYSKELVDELIGLGNFHGVTGNHDFGDIQLRLPKKDVLEVNGKKIGLIHGHGCVIPNGLHKGLIAKFNGDKTDAILYGHTHIAMSKVLDGVLLFNPGSVSGRFPAHKRTYGVLTVGDTVTGEIININGAHRASVPKPIRDMAYHFGYGWSILIRNI
jgi:putative phosphoesterase